MKDTQQPLVAIIDGGRARARVPLDEGLQVREACERVADVLELEALAMPACQVQVLMEDLAIQLRRRARIALVPGGRSAR